jgi:hypothetical protein
LPRTGLGVGPLLDLKNLARDMPVDFTVHRRGRFLTRGFDQTEDLP